MSWVVGRGLLGSNVERLLREQGRVWFTPEALRWSEPAVVRGQLAAVCRAFATVAEGRPWQVAWCAGVGTMAATPESLDVETDTFRQFLADLGSSTEGTGALFLASSAGGAYAGSPAPPFTEVSPVWPISAYGRAKLEQEAAATAWAQREGHRVVIGRIANLYGPGQDLLKPQGLISQVVKAGLLRQPVVLYVPLDTLRDFLYAPDCAASIVAALERTREGEAGTVTTKILASQRSVSVAAVLAEVRRVLKKQPLLALAASPLAASQRRDLRLRSIVWSDLDARPQVTLAEGVRAVVADIQLAMGQPTPAAMGR